MRACISSSCPTGSFPRAAPEPPGLALPAPSGPDAINITFSGYGGAELNLCSEQQCGFPSRAELQVRAPTGELVWAPVCSVDEASEENVETIANVMCNQVCKATRTARTALSA